MSRTVVVGGLTWLAVLSAPATAGDWHRAPPVPWYQQEPWIGTGPGYYYSQHPDHIPAYPKRLTGVVVPIYDTGAPVVRVVPGAAVAAHEAWCTARYRSYDPWTDSYQPRHGPRRYCNSPYR